MTTTRTHVGALALLVLTAAVPAWAGGVLEDCRHLTKNGRHDDALACYAGKEGDHKAAYYYKAGLLEELGRLAPALTAYEDYLASGHTGFKAKAEARVQDLRARGHIEAQCSPAGAVVWLDDEPVGACPWKSGWLEPRSYRVAVRVRGEQRSVEEVLVNAGETTTCCSPPPPVSSADYTWAQWTLVGVGALGFIVGGAFQAANLSAQEALAADLGNDTLATDVDDTLYASIAGYSIGLTATVAGLVWMLGGDSDALAGMTRGGMGWTMTW